MNFRWGASQVDLLKQAAALANVPYQTYVKIVLYRQAVADLQQRAAPAQAMGPGVSVKRVIE